MNRAWEIIEHESPRYGHKMGYKHESSELDEAFECGFEKGYKKALKELEMEGHRYGSRYGRKMPYYDYD